ncbi:MAG: succinate--CoA ligase subunit alpha [Candidatus Bipolaricaulia bacterium]
MSILLTAGTRAIVQGGPGRVGARQTEWMLRAGTRLVGAVTPGKGGTDLHGLPVYDSVAEAVERTGADASILFVPAAGVRGAVLEAADAGVGLVVVIAEHVPVHDALEAREACREAGCVMIGPNSPGIISPGIGKLGIMPADAFAVGRLGMISRSGTLAYEVAAVLQSMGMGVSTMIGIGGDPVLGTDMADLVPRFVADPDTDALVVVGEIGGTQEERLATLPELSSLPVCAFLAGYTAPFGRPMGHAGAVMSSAQGSAARKAGVLERAGVRVAKSPRGLAEMLREAVERRTA